MECKMEYIIAKGKCIVLCVYHIRTQDCDVKCFSDNVS